MIHTQANITIRVLVWLNVNKYCTVIMIMWICKYIGGGGRVLRCLVIVVIFWFRSVHGCCYISCVPTCLLFLSPSPCLFCFSVSCTRGCLVFPFWLCCLPILLFSVPLVSCLLKLIGCYVRSCVLCLLHFSMCPPPCVVESVFLFPGLLTVWLCQSFVPCLCVQFRSNKYLVINSRTSSLWSSVWQWEWQGQADPL